MAEMPTTTDVPSDSSATDLTDETLAGLEASATSKPPSVVRIGGPGIPNHALDFEAGVTVGEWLKRAGIVLAHGQTANVGSRRADLEDILQEGAAISVASQIKNG